MAQQNAASAVGIKVKCGGNDIDPKHLVAFSIEQDLGQPDMCVVTIRNEDNKYSTSLKVADPVDISAGDGNGGRSSRAR